jgi:hypothetical protein
MDAPLVCNQLSSYEEQQSNVKGIYTMPVRTRWISPGESRAFSLQRLSPLPKALLLALATGVAIALLVGGLDFHSQSLALDRGEITRAAALQGALHTAELPVLIGATAIFAASFTWLSVGGTLGAWFALGAGAMSGVGVHGALHNFQLHPAEAATPIRQAALPDPAPNSSAPALPAETAGIRRDEEESRRLLFAKHRFNGPYNDRVLLLGMNKEASTSEYRRLRRITDISLIVDSGRQDQVTLNGQHYDLRSNAGVDKFARSLGLPPQTTERTAQALKSCDRMARDEMAQLAAKWARAEKGQVVLPSRLMLGGHSNGDGVWGDNNGSLRLGPLLQLAEAMPRAACQIEDLLVTGCYTGGELTMEQYRYIFPQVKTIWAYENQAPGSDTGAMLHQTGWVAATRGRSTGLTRAIAQGDQKKIAIWTKTRGYSAWEPPLDTNALRGKVQWLQQHAFYPAFNGLPTTDIDGFHIPIEITDPHAGLVRQYYGWLVRLTQRKDLSEEERARWIAKKHQTIRLLYYNETVAPRFMREHAAAIRAGYAAVGLTPPDYASLRRGAALKQIKRFAYKVQSTPHAKPEAKETLELLKRGLWHHDPEVIPDGWV